MKINKTRILSGTVFGTVILWDRDTGKPILTMDGHTGSIMDVLFLT